jgi:hypothetical protein
MAELTQSSPVAANSTSVTFENPKAIRYPKRVHKEVKYYVSDDAEDDSSYDTKDVLPLAKVGYLPWVIESC